MSLHRQEFQLKSDREKQEQVQVIKGMLLRATEGKDERSLDMALRLADGLNQLYHAGWLLIKADVELAAAVLREIEKVTRPKVDLSEYWAEAASEPARAEALRRQRVIAEFQRLCFQASEAGAMTGSEIDQVFQACHAAGKPYAWASVKMAPVPAYLPTGPFE